MSVKRTHKRYAKPRVFYTTFQASTRKLTSAIAFGELCDLVKKFSRRGFRLISIQENAWLRIFKGKYAPESWTGNFLREGFLYIPDNGVFLVKDSPINDQMVNATVANRLGNEYKITFAEADKIAKNSVKIPYDLKEIPVAKFQTNPVSRFAFGNALKSYADFLLEAGIDKLPLWILPKGLVDAQSQPFVRQAIFRCMDNWSGLIGSHADLHESYGARFVSSSYKGKIDDVDEVYSSTEIVQGLRAASLSGLEIPVLRALRQSSSLPVDYSRDPFTWGNKRSLNKTCR